MLGDGLPNSGTQGSWFKFQYAVLTLLNQIVTAVGGGTNPPAQRVPTLIRVTGAGSIAAGKRSVSVYNAGNTNGTWLGAIIKPGEQFSYDADESNELLAFAYNGTGTELVITTLS